MNTAKENWVLILRLQVAWKRFSSFQWLWDDGKLTYSLSNLIPRVLMAFKMAKNSMLRKHQVTWLQKYWRFWLFQIGSRLWDWLTACQNMPSASNFAAFSQFLVAYSTLDFTRSPLAGKGTWCLLPTATKHFDRAERWANLRSHDLLFARVFSNPPFSGCPKVLKKMADFAKSLKIHHNSPAE